MVKSKCLLFPVGMDIFEIWHNPLNVSALAIGKRTMKKKKIYEHRQMNLETYLPWGKRAMK